MNEINHQATNTQSDKSTELKINPQESAVEKHQKSYSCYKSDVLFFYIVCKNT